MDLQSRATRLVLVSGGLLVGAGALAFAAFSRPAPATIAEGVRVADMNWGGLGYAAARDQMTAWRKKHLADKVTLRLPAEIGIHRTWSPACQDLGLAPDVDATVRAAQQATAPDVGLGRVFRLFRPARSVLVRPVWKVDEARVRRYLNRRIARRVARPRRDARLVVASTGWQVLPDAPGRALDVKAGIRLIADHATDQAKADIVLPVVPVAPRVRAADLHDIDGEIGSFHTTFAENGNRADNIRVACAKINGTVLLPGQRFSYNEVVGPREAENGFHLAPVIVHGKLEPGMGGGVCQVSSTLYNAALLANLKVVRRTHHAFPVHYLPAGRDATVAYGSIDFQFENSTSSPIAISSSAAGSTVTMRIFGKTVPGQQVVIDRSGVSSWGPDTQTVRDSSVASGRRVVVEDGKAGHRVTVTRTVLVNGAPVKREIVSHDVYQSFPRVVAVGRAAPRRSPVVRPPAVRPTAGAAEPTDVAVQ